MIERGELTHRILSIVIVLFSVALTATPIVTTASTPTTNQVKLEDNGTSYMKAAITVPDDYPTIQEAINNAEEGDIIYIKAGTYYESIVVNKGISLIGENKNTTIIDGNMSDYVIRIQAENVKIYGFTIQNAHLVHVRFYNNNSLLENNRVLGTDISNSYWGVYLGSCNNNTVKGNIIENCGEGIMVESSSHNKIIENTIMNNYRGITLTTSPSTPEAPPPPPSICNFIYHNNFINNSRQAADYGGNWWENGYPSGGNYWSDYNGTDFYSGPHQNETGSDGIGDTPYIIPDNGVDYYPLMNPYPVRNVKVPTKILRIPPTPKTEIKCILEFSSPYSAEDVNISSVYMKGPVAVHPKNISLGDEDNNGIQDITVNFNPHDLIGYALFQMSENVRNYKFSHGFTFKIKITLTGTIKDLTFEASGFITVSSNVNAVPI